MPDQPPQTITCPVCANVNPWSQELCLRAECHFDLRPIKHQIMGSAPAGNPPAPPTPPQPSEPAPPLPELPERGKDEPIAKLEASRRFLIPGLGDRADEIAARFFKRVGERGIDGVKLSVGKLVINLAEERTDSRDYYFVERDLGESALATMAVRTAPNGTDLFVEWRHYTTPSWRKVTFVRGDGCVFVGFLTVVSVAAAGGGLSFATSGSQLAGQGVPFVLVGGLVLAGCIKLLTMKTWERYFGLVGFQGQESTAFQLSIRAALAEAIDDAGIDRSLLRGLDGRGGPNEPLI